MRFPSAAAGRRGAVRDGRRRRADGPDHEGVSGLAALRRRSVAAELWPRVKKAPSRLPGSKGAGTPIGTACSRARSTTRTTSSSTGRTRCAASITSARCAPCEEMAHARGRRGDRHASTGASSRRAATWIDAHLFNGEYYMQQVRGCRATSIAAALRNTMGSDETEQPEYQMGSRLPRRSARRPIPGRRGGPRPACSTGALPEDAGEHLPLQLQARAVRARHRPADIRSERRERRSSSATTAGGAAAMCRSRTTPRS